MFGEDDRFHRRHDVRETSADALRVEEKSCRAETMAARVLTILQAAGPDGLTDRTLLRRVRELPGLDRVVKDSVSPARNLLWRRFQVVPTGERAFLEDLETGAPTKAVGEKWCAVDCASAGQVEEAAREWRGRFPFAQRQFDYLDQLATSAAREGRLGVAVDGGLLRRLIAFARSGQRVDEFDPRALAAELDR